MPRLALEHPIKLLDRLVELLATIQLVRQQEVIENAVKRSTPGRPFGSGRLHPITEPIQVTRTTQVEGPGGGNEPLGLVEQAQGPAQVPVRLGRLLVGR